ncbi:MAG: PIN domain-containing protein [Armatimonadota bacterium]
MGNRTEKTIILDTNILMHYRQADEIDWCKELEADKVELLITPVVIEEIEKHNAQNQSRKLRSRANHCIKWISSQITNDSLKTVIRKGISLCILDAEPSIDFHLNRLDKDIKDDRIIAHAIEWNENHPDGPAIILTTDPGIRVKAMGRKLPLILWGDNKYKLPSDPDPLEKRNEELVREITLLKNRMPKLEVKFENDEKCKEFVLKPRSKQEKETELDREWNTYKLGRGVMPAGLAAIMTDDQYELNVRKYYASYEKYLNEVSEYESSVVTLNLLLTNTGSATADDVRIELTLPNELDIKLYYDLPRKPEPPKMPRPNEVFVPGISLGPNHLKGSLPKMNNINFVWHTETKQHDLQSFSYCVGTAMHGIPTRLPSIYIVFDNNLKTSSFEVEYTIFSRDVLEPVSGKILVKIQQQMDI